MSPLQPGDNITIRYSKKLEKNGHLALVNKSGVVERLAFYGKTLVGAYVKIKTIKRQKNYLIPLCSIEKLDEVNKLRVLSILKSTTL